VTALKPGLLRGDQPVELLEAVGMLHSAGVVGVPTDTVYGLAASLFHAEAVERVFEIKGRATTAPLPVLVSSAADLTLVTAGVPRVAWDLINRFWPGPLTIVLAARPGLPAAVTAEGRTVAVRVPAGRTVLQLLQALAEPITGTSANRSGEPAAKTAAEVVSVLGDSLDAVVADDASVRAGVASTVVEITGDEAVVTRLGAVSLQALRDALGPRAVVRHAS
jgi:L-threonylcarbamoyladenylate synthase